MNQKTRALLRALKLERFGNPPTWERAKTPAQKTAADTKKQPTQPAHE